MAFTSVLPIQSRSGTFDTGFQPLSPGISRFLFRLDTDAQWPTYTDGRKVRFDLSFSQDGGTTVSATDGPWTFEGASPIPTKAGAFLFGDNIAPGANAVRAKWAVQDAAGNLGPTIDFGLSLELS